MCTLTSMCEWFDFEWLTAEGVAVQCECCFGRSRAFEGDECISFAVARFVISNDAPVAHHVFTQWHQCSVIEDLEQGFI